MTDCVSSSLSLLNCTKKSITAIKAGTPINTIIIDIKLLSIILSFLEILLDSGQKGALIFETLGDFFELTVFKIQ
jgi:hypothetical protein